MRGIAIAAVIVCLVAGCGSNDDAATPGGEKPRIVLEADGLGIVSFGDGVEEALEKLTAVLGEPTVDQTLTPPWPESSSSWKTAADQPCTQATGYKCVDYLRRVVWSQWGLAVVFSDVSGYSMALQPHVTGSHLVIWEQWVPPNGASFTLGSGIGPGSSVSELREQYETDLADMAFGCPGGNVDTTGLDLADGTIYVLPGNDTTSATPLAPSTEITFMWAGFHKECRYPLPFEGPRDGAIVTSAAAPAACGYLGEASIEQALHQERIQLSAADSDAHPEAGILAQLAAVCPDVDETTIDHVCEQYRIAVDPEEIAHRERIHGSYYADKQTRYHWQNATWTAAWILAARGEDTTELAVQQFLRRTCGLNLPEAQVEPPTSTSSTPTTTISPLATATDQFSVAALNGTLTGLPGSGGAAGSGCTPGSADLPDGIWAGWITDHGPGHADFDLVCIYPAPERTRISNQSGRIRTVTVDEAAIVHAASEGGEIDQVPYESWWQAPQSRFCTEAVEMSPDLPDGCPSLLFINGGRVTEILEFWVP